MTNRVYIGFSTTNMLLSRLIRWFTRSKVSHCWFRVYDPTLEQWLVLSAGLLGYEIYLYPKYKKGNTVVAEFVSGMDLFPATKEMVKDVGDTFDFCGLLGMGLVTAARRWFNTKIKNPFNDSGKMFCSEAVTRLIQLGKIEGAGSFDPAITTPDMLLRFLSVSPQFARVG